MAELSLDADLSTVSADLELLAQAAERSLEIRQLLLDLVQGGAQFVCVDSEVLFAGPAGELRVQFQLADCLRDLVAAVRAGKFDGFAVQQSSHGHPSRTVV